MLVLDNAQSDQIVDDIAGALKNFLTVHGDNALKRVEQACEYNRRLRLAVSRLAMAQSDELYSRWHGLKTKYSVDTQQ
jgi:hypothetical protein